jgi:osmoprotectant transport system substrate-binding protein
MAGIAAASVALVACGGDGDTESTPFVPRRVTIAYGPSPESQLLTEIYAKALENTGVRVARKQTVLDRTQALAALTSGEIQFYIESSSALLLELDPDADVSPTTSTAPPSTTTPPSTTSTTVAGSTTTSELTTVPALTTTTLSPLQKALPTGIASGVPSNLDTAEVVACKLPEGSTVTALSGLPEIDDQLRLAAPAGFGTAEPFGAATLKERYEITFKQIVDTAPDAMKATFDAAGAECAVLRSIDPLIETAELTPLIDDRGLQPQQLAVPLMSAEAAVELSFTVDAVSALLDEATVRSMMKLIEVDKVSVSLVADSFLSQGG